MAILGYGLLAARALGGMRAIGTAIVLAAALCVATAGCGGSARPASSAAAARARPAQVAEHVCSRLRRPAAALVGRVDMRVVDPDPTNLECLLSGQGIRVDVVAQATAQAWTEYDTTVVHQVQAYGSGSVHAPSQLPTIVRGLGGNAVWIPALHELVATNGTPSVGGTYLTVKVTRTTARGPASLALARAIARATLASAPRGPDPAPPSG